MGTCLVTKKYCESNNICSIIIITKMILHSVNGWLGTPYPVMCGCELEVPHKLELRGYAVKSVTRMVLYK